MCLHEKVWHAKGGTDAKLRFWLWVRSLVAWRINGGRSEVRYTHLRSTKYLSLIPLCEWYKLRFWMPFISLASVQKRRAFKENTLRENSFPWGHSLFPLSDQRGSKHVCKAPILSRSFPLCDKCYISMWFQALWLSAFSEWYNVCSEKSL